MIRIQYFLNRKGIDKLCILIIYIYSYNNIYYNNIPIYIYSNKYTLLKN